MNSKPYLLIVFDCLNPCFNITKKYNKFCNNYNVAFFDFNRLKSLKQTVKINDINDELDHWIQSIVKTSSAQLNFIIYGQIGLWVYHHIQKYNPNSIFLLSTPFPQSIINPYLSNHPSYKDNPDHYKIQLAKMSHCISKLNVNFDELYNEYHNNYQFYESISSQLNDYIYLRPFCRNIVKPNHHFIFGLQNQLLNIKRHQHYLRKYNAKYLILPNCGYLTDLDDTNCIAIDYISSHLN